MTEIGAGDHLGQLPEALCLSGEQFLQPLAVTIALANPGQFNSIGQAQSGKGLEDSPLIIA